MKDFIFSNWLTESHDRIYSAKTMLSNSQFAIIKFTESKWIEGSSYSVFFEIRNKRRYCSYDDNEITGKCGLEGLIWAKKMILKFEKYALENLHQRYCTGTLMPLDIAIGWTDSRRKKTYIWALEKYGYKYEASQKMLIKRLYGKKERYKK